ncbi:hypothetical protein Hypma_013478 [Hypsizygus marmoreus]|uniref:N-acetyltransferase domain-containing protein n=1 Tax=Hypsizygus marmoreus TaxID=39966 RepID=A0A369JBN1_HYPMA|nr:hypothetical protein Hypma_013478 [Hypsizygus marmoreus]
MTLREDSLDPPPQAHRGPNPSMPAEEYEPNFCFPVKDLESERVKLTPFIPSKHAEAFFALTSPSYDYLPFGPFATADEFVSILVEGRIHPNPECVLFAVYDKSKTPETGVPDGTIAGAIGYCNSSAVNLVAEIAFVLISPQFQRTHVTSNAIGLLLHYALDLPSEGGLGLRRVVWQASPMNGPSIGAAERMGFKKEGLLRWHYVLKEDKQTGNGRERRKGDPKPNLLGRDTAVLGLCWDDWEDSEKDRVDAVMSRRS